MSTTDEQRLLPCPFCGGTPRMSIVWSVGVDDFWAGECGACEATLSGKPSQDEAATCWNRRSAVAQQAPTPAVLPEPVAREAEAPAVTRQSAIDALDHMQQHNGPGRYSEARRMLVEAPTPRTAESSEPAAPVDVWDALRLDWIARQGDEFVSGIIVDRPGDGDYYVYGCGTIAGQGKTFLEALDFAMVDDFLTRQAAGEKS